jgi:hypothetical protein
LWRGNSRVSQSSPPPFFSFFFFFDTSRYGVQPKKSVAFYLTGIPNFPTSKHVLINYETSPPTFSQKIRLVDPTHTHSPLDLLLFTKYAFHFRLPGFYCDTFPLINFTHSSPLRLPLPLFLTSFTREEAPGVYKITVYGSSWLINNTQLPLYYKVPKIYEMPEAEVHKGREEGGGERRGRGARRVSGSRERRGRERGE